MEETKKSDDTEELDLYADGSITSSHGKIPLWLWCFYLLMPLWGIVWLYIYWNGSHGWLDNGYWQQLQRAANTTEPYINVNLIEQPKEPAPTSEGD